VAAKERLEVANALAKKQVASSFMFTV
jgi:hypothetical protein